MAQYLGTVKLGGFYNNGAALARPTKPWRNDSEPYSGVSVGAISLDVRQHFKLQLRQYALGRRKEAPVGEDQGRRQDAAHL